MEPIRDNRFLPKRAINAVDRGSALVAKLYIADEPGSWSVTRGFRRHSDYRSPFVSGFNEWVSRILSGDMRLERCYQIGEKSAPELLAELRRVYGNLTAKD